MCHFVRSFVDGSRVSYRSSYHTQAAVPSVESLDFHLYIVYIHICKYGTTNIQSRRVEDIDRNQVWHTQQLTMNRNIHNLMHVYVQSRVYEKFVSIYVYIIFMYNVLYKGERLYVYAHVQSTRQRAMYGSTRIIINYEHDYWLRPETDENVRHTCDRNAGFRHKKDHWCANRNNW